MKSAVKPADIVLPAWLKRIGEDRIARIQTRLSQIHHSQLGTADLGYVPLRRAFDAVAFELSSDPEFGRLYFRIRELVVDLAGRLGWIRPEWLTEFNPDRALPQLPFEASISGRLFGERWRGAYPEAYRDYLIQLAAAQNTIRSSEAEAEAPAPDQPPDLREGPIDPVLLETGPEGQFAAHVSPIVATTMREVDPESDSPSPDTRETLFIPPLQPNVDDTTPGSKSQPSAMNGTNIGTDQRAVIDAFISKLVEAGRKITRKDIWMVAGYKNATEFERFQRGDARTTRSAAAAFNRILSMTPEKFIELLDKKSTPR